MLDRDVSYLCLYETQSELRDAFSTKLKMAGNNTSKRSLEAVFPSSWPILKLREIQLI